MWVTGMHIQVRATPAFLDPKSELPAVCIWHTAIEHQRYRNIKASRSDSGWHLLFWNGNSTERVHSESLQFHRTPSNYDVCPLPKNNLQINSNNSTITLSRAPFRLAATVPLTRLAVLAVLAITEALPARWRSRPEGQPEKSETSNLHGDED